MWWTPFLAGAKGLGARYLPHLLIGLGALLAGLVLLALAYSKGQSKAEADCALRIEAIEGRHAAEIAAAQAQALAEWAQREAKINEAAQAEAERLRLAAERLDRAWRGIRSRFDEDAAKNPVGVDCRLPASRLRIVNEARACTDPDPRNRPSVCRELF